jgi:hypothetical protein
MQRAAAVPGPFTGVYGISGSESVAITSHRTVLVSSSIRYKQVVAVPSFSEPGITANQ